MYVSAIYQYSFNINLFLVVDMLQPLRRSALEVLTISKYCDEAPGTQTHDNLRSITIGPRYTYCGRRWAQSIDLEADDNSRPSESMSEATTPGSRYRSPSTSGYASSEGRGMPERLLPSASSSSASPNDRLNNLRHVKTIARTAYIATKPSKAASPFVHKFGQISDLSQSTHWASSLKVVFSLP